MVLASMNVIFESSVESLTIFSSRQCQLQSPESSIVFLEILIIAGLHKFLRFCGSTVFNVVKFFQELTMFTFFNASNVLKPFKGLQGFKGFRGFKGFGSFQKF